MSDEIKTLTETTEIVENEPIVEDTDSENATDTDVTNAANNLLSIDRQMQVEMMTAHLKNAKSIEALASSHIAMTSVILYMAEQLRVQLPVMWIDVNTGEAVSKLINISKDGSYDSKEMPQIIALVKVAVDRSASLIRNAKAASDAAEQKAQTLQRELSEAKELIRKLRVVVRHPTIDDKPFVVAYINNKGEFRYLGLIEKENKKPFKGRVSSYNKALKFPTAQDAYTALVELLQNFNHPITNAFQMKIYSASLIEADNLPGNELLIKLREKAEQYEQMMRVDNGAKVKKKKHKKSTGKLRDSGEKVLRHKKRKAV